MSEDMSDMMSKINSLFGEKGIPEDVKNMLGSIANNNQNSNSSSTQTSSDSVNNASGIDINTVLKMQQVMQAMNSEKSNPRANLLRSLKPYLKPSRQDKVEQYIQLFNMEKVFEIMKPTGGDKK